MDILATIQAETETLSRSEKRIAEILFADTEFAINASIIELATRAEVSPPTVTRFCRRLNCASFSEFKVRLAQTTFVGNRYLHPDTAPATPAETAQDIVTHAQTALYNMHAALDTDALDRAAQAVAGARMVYAFGSGGNSAMIAQEIQNRLFRLGLSVTASIDHQMQLMQAAAAGPEDVIVVSSLSGNNLQLVKALEVAADYRVPSFALTRPGSPVAKAAQHVLPIDLAEGSNILKPTAARYAFLAMTDILATLVAMRSEARATETLRRIKHQVVTHRDGTDSEALGD